MDKRKAGAVERWIDTARAAEILGCTPRKVRQLIAGQSPYGRLAATRIADRWALREADVLAFARLARPTGRPRREA